MATSRFTSRSREGALLAALTLALVAACSNGSSPSASCPAAQPSGCPKAPSYTTDVAPLVKRECLTCHAPGGQSSDRDFTTYAGFTRYQTTVLSQLNGCLMPPSGAPPRTLAERTTILQWIVCGAPDN